MTYGKDYGINADIPWYIKCPIVNWFFNTCKVKVSLTTFSDDGRPMLGVTGKFRIPYKNKVNYINSILKLKYCFPNDQFDFGNGLWVDIELQDINHRRVYGRSEQDQYPTDKFPEVGYKAKPQKKFRIWFGTWHSELVDVTFNKKDYGRKVQK